MDGSRRRGRLAGGIIYVVDQLENDQVRLEVENELINRGLRFRWLGDGTDRLTWHDLAVIIRTADPDTQLGRELRGEPSEWSLDQYLLASLVDGVHLLLWQNGGPKAKKPELLPRPGDTRVERVSDAPPDQQSVGDGPQGNPFNADESGVFRGMPTPIGELNEWLGWV